MCCLFLIETPHLKLPSGTAYEPLKINLCNLTILFQNHLKVRRKISKRFDGSENIFFKMTISEDSSGGQTLKHHDHH